jgi:hypothetical protein
MAKQQQLNEVEAVEVEAVEHLFEVLKAERGCMLYEKNGNLKKVWINVNKVEAIGILELTKHSALNG